jgi:glutamate synthase domain-containing protein 3
MANFKGRANNIKQYLINIGEEVRRELASLGFDNLQSLVGRTDLLSVNTMFKKYVRTMGLDFSYIFNPDAKKGLPVVSSTKVKFQNMQNTVCLDEEIINEVRGAILTHGHAVVAKIVNNTQRSIGTRLSGEIAFLYGKGNFNGSIQIQMSGTAGQSFGAYLSDGVELRLRGGANDYVGKGQSGGLITIRMPTDVRRKKKEHTLIGNVALYGATGGTLFVAGRGGERFAVRNSGASAVIEGIGNHGCEYMTRGTVVVLGEIGHNFGAGMTGGQAFIYSKNNPVTYRLNKEFVKEKELSISDEHLIQRLLKNHIFHTDSIIAESILSNWINQKKFFKCIVSIAQEIMDFQDIYDLHAADRLGVVLNE